MHKYMNKINSWVFARLMNRMLFFSLCVAQSMLNTTISLKQKCFYMKLKVFLNQISLYLIIVKATENHDIFCKEKSTSSRER